MHAITQVTQWSTSNVIIDYREQSYPCDIDADICIVGAGAAGLSIARSFIGSSLSVCVLESGGFSVDDQNQVLNNGVSVGISEFDAEFSRIRIFGGTSYFWGGGCIPLSSMDRRDWVPHDGWPIDFEELKPWYQRAREFCGLQAHDFSEDTFLSRPHYAPLQFNTPDIVNKIYTTSPYSFGDTYKEEFERAANISVVLYANLLELQASAGARSVSQGRIGSLTGRTGHVRARHFVLAGGGIENARMLLLSDSLNAAGLGNDHDQVGRYFMDHPTCKLGKLYTDDSDRLLTPYDQTLGQDRGSAFPEICLSGALQRQQAVLDARVRVYGVEGAVPRGIEAMRELKARFRQETVDENSSMLKQLRIRNNGEPQLDDSIGTSSDCYAALAMRACLGAHDIAKGIFRKHRRQPVVKSDHVTLAGYFEQAPNPESRILLGNERDSLGLRRAHIDWRFTDLDRRTWRTAAEQFGQALARETSGRFEMEPWLRGDDTKAAPQLHGMAHHMGTTRMSEDPRQGVVDSDCQVHGIDNLHVAGSSVFPTAGGWAFPTFAIVALSERLAAHLKTRCV
jgi:choline dehydrogenase-like flavoprotein